MGIARISSFRLVVIFSTLLLGCRRGDFNFGEENVLRELAAAHTWLVPKGKDPATCFQPWRRSWCENSNVEMTLFRSPDSLVQGHLIVLFKHEGLEKPVGLVLPSNASTDYWNFECDSMVGPLRDTSNFGDELLRVARSLGMAEHPNEYRSLVFDLFRGLLLTEMVQAGDSAIEWRLTTTTGLPEDEDSSSWLRRDCIMTALGDTVNGVGIPPRPIAFLDNSTERIFLFEPQDLYGREPPRGRVRVFRLGQNVILVDL